MMAATAPAAHFGQGQHEPYARALQTGSGTLTLRPEGEHHPGEPVEFDVRDWCEEASLMERSLLQSLQGPVLDVGCGPGRLLAAARPLGLAALGIDTSTEAVRRTRSRGACALEQSIFAPYRNPVTGNRLSCSTATSASEGASAPCCADAGSSLRRRGRCWWRWKPTRGSTPSIRPCWKTSEGTGASRSPGPGQARRAWHPGRRPAAGPSPPSSTFRAAFFAASRHGPSRSVQSRKQGWRQ